MDVLIRPYQETDLAACRGLWVELTQQHRDLYADPGIGGEDPRLNFDRYLVLPDLSGVWVAEVDGQAAGFTGLLVDGEEAVVEPVVVTAHQRSQGIGRQLIERAIQEARQAGVRFLSIRPVARNVEAIQLFVSLGFNLVGQVELFQDLSPDSTREWKEGISIHDLKLRY